MQLSFEVREGVGVLALAGRLDLDSAELLRREFETHQSASGLNRFVADLGQVGAIDSSGLGALIACLKTASEQGGDLRVCSIRSGPSLTFEITRADRAFEIFDDLESALESYR